MPQFPNDALEAELCHGDLLLQFCSNTAETNIHALRDISEAYARPAGAALEDRRLLAAAHGAQARQGDRAQPARLQGRHRQSRRRRRQADGRHRLGQPGAGEPAWTQGGSYQVVRDHPHVRRALGPDRARRAADDHRPRKDERRAARRGAGARRPRLRRPIRRRARSR